MKKLAVLIDGGHVRALAKNQDLVYDPDLIEKVALGSATQGEEEIFRVLYYDCAPYQGQVPLPVSGEIKSYSGGDQWLRDLACRDLFAVRRGVLKFRGFKPRRIPVSAETLNDSDFSPVFEQKGVDMRIGLDMASLAGDRIVDRIGLLTNDTDCLPAMKQVRKAGRQVVLIAVPGYKPTPELVAHADFLRTIEWPSQRTPRRCSKKS